MRNFATILIAGLLLAHVAAPYAAACPMCAEAIANSGSSSGEDEVDGFPAAMNQSIYLMIGVAYMTFGVVGFMIYRGVQRNAEYLNRTSESQDELRS